MVTDKTFMPKQTSVMHQQEKKLSECRRFSYIFSCEVICLLCCLKYETNKATIIETKKQHICTLALSHTLTRIRAHARTHPPTHPPTHTHRANLYCTYVIEQCFNRAHGEEKQINLCNRNLWRSTEDNGDEGTHDRHGDIANRYWHRKGVLKSSIFSRLWHCVLLK